MTKDRHRAALKIAIATVKIAIATLKIAAAIVKIATSDLQATTHKTLKTKITGSGLMSLPDTGWKGKPEAGRKRKREEATRTAVHTCGPAGRRLVRRE